MTTAFGAAASSGGGSVGIGVSVGKGVGVGVSVGVDEAVGMSVGVNVTRGVFGCCWRWQGRSNDETTRRTSETNEH